MTYSRMMQKKCKKVFVKTTLVSALLFCFVANSFAQSGATAPTHITNGALPSYLDRTVAIAQGALTQDLSSGVASSASVAIIDQGRLVYSEGFGLADREHNTMVNNETLFNIGSISKEFTASAIMALVDEGKVSLDEKVVRYLPEFTMADPRYTDITVRMLLNHSSGISGTNWGNGMGFAPDREYTKETLHKLSEQHLKFAPGDFAAYCNDGFTLAELVVERVSGMSFIAYVAEKVLSPLGLTHTGLSIGLRGNVPMAFYYDPESGKREPPEVVSILGAGGMASTAEELCRFAYSFSGNGPQFLSQKSSAEMRMEQPSRAKLNYDPATWPFGLGWDFVRKSPFSEAGIKVLGKGGNTGRYTSQIITAPDCGISIAIAESAAAAPAAITAMNMLAAALEDKGLLVPHHAAAPGAAVPARAHQPIPSYYSEFGGYYGSTGYLLRLEFDFERNELKAAALYQGHEMPLPSAFYSDGTFIGESGNSIRLESINGIRCSISEIPFGTEVNAQQLKALEHPQALSIDVAGTLWLRRDIGPFESRSMALFNPFTVSNTVPGLPGYVDFDGVKEVTSPNTAMFATTFLRDQTELSLFEHDGQTWAKLSYKVMSPAAEMPPLARGFSATTIGKEGYNEWLRADEELMLQFEKSSHTRVRVYSPSLSPLYDSAIDSGAARLEKGCLIELAGLPGDRIALTAMAKDSWTLGDTMSMWDISDVDVSPDGTRVVFTASTSMRDGSLINPVQQVFISDIDGKNKRSLTSADSPSFHAQWSPDGRWVSFISTKSGKFELWLTPAEGGEAVQISHVQTAVYAYRWSRDGSRIGYIDPDSFSAEELKAIAAGNDPQIVDEQDKMVHLWTVSARPDAQGSYATRKITSGNFCVSAWDFSPDMTSVVLVRQDHLLPLYEYPSMISTLDLQSGAMKDIVPPIDRGCYNTVSFSPDGKQIAFSTSHSFFTLMDVSIIPSVGGTPILLAKDQSQSSLLNTLGLLGWSPDGAYVYYSNARATQAAITAQPVDGGPSRDIIARGYMAGGKINSSGTAIGLILEDSSNPSEVWAAFLSGNNDLRAQKVTSLNTGVPDGKIWQTKIVRWKSFDGRTIEGILTLPAGVPPDEGFPLIVEAHGGPSFSFFEYYPGGKSWLISPAGALASQGFALLRPNVRGSTGYGAEFTYANLADWGGGDFKDILAGVDSLAAQKIADPNRVAIMGQSYGGYMAAWAITQTNRFKASVDIDGITDLTSDALTTDIPHYMADNLGGFVWENAKLYRDRSPITHVTKVRTPTLVLQGQNDIRVPLGQAQEFHTALKLLNVPTRMVIYPRAGHYPGEPAQQMDMWERETEWFLTYLGTPTPSPTPQADATTGDKPPATR